MAIYQIRSLLGCNTLEDWLIIYNEMPQLFCIETQLEPQHQAAIVYFALQKVAPFQVCVLKYRDRYQLLSGQQELKALIDFVSGKITLRKEQWMLPVPFPSGKSELSFSNGLSLSEKERFFAAPVPHFDFIITGEDDLNLLRCLYGKTSA